MRMSIFVKVLAAFCIVGCNEKPVPSTNEPHTITDTIIKDIPVSLRGIIQDVNKRLNLQPLENGFNGLQIRLFRSYAFSDTLFVTVFTENDSNWKAELMKCGYAETTKNDSFSTTKLSVIREPNSGWKTFVDSLLKLNILTLPDSEKIPGYSEAMDGGTVTVEFANKTHHRIYSYATPEANLEIPEAKTALQILQLIEDEFNFKGFTRLNR